MKLLTISKWHVSCSNTQIILCQLININFINSASNSHPINKLPKFSLSINQHSIFIVQFQMAVFRKMFPLIMVIMTLLAINSDKACAGDPDMLQDVCVADLTSSKLKAKTRF